MPNICCSIFSFFCRALAEKEMWENYIKSLYNEHSKDKKTSSAVP